MGKTSSRSYFLLAVLFAAVSLMWFLRLRDVAIGIIWACAAILELVIGLITLRKEKKKQ